MKKPLPILVYAPETYAQKADTSAAPAYGWKNSLVGSANLTQVAFTDLGARWGGGARLDPHLGLSHTFL